MILPFLSISSIHMKIYPTLKTSLINYAGMTQWVTSTLYHLSSENIVPFRYRATVLSTRIDPKSKFSEYSIFLKILLGSFHIILKFSVGQLPRISLQQTWPSVALNKRLPPSKLYATAHHQKNKFTVNTQFKIEKIKYS